MTRRLLLAGCSAVLVIAVVAATAWALLHVPGPKQSGTTVVSIAQGTGFEKVAEQLRRAGLVRHPLPLVLLARWSGADRQIGWGEYAVESPIRPVDILARLTEPPDPFHRVTIPEGLTLRETVALLVAEDLGSEDSFRCLLDDPRFLAATDLPPEGAEGYLFPDTYTFPRTMSQERILHTMIQRFRAQTGPAFDLRAKAVGLSPHEAVTLASLVEEETAVPDERRIVSAVFHNRLRRGMRLQSDPTVLYGRHDPTARRITRRDLARATPHNTYVIPGLPPTPISSPGVEALRAAVDPAPVDYLYFVARGDGSHEFSRTLAAHETAVDRFIRRR